MKEKLDKIIIGFVFGILMPLLFGYLFLIKSYTGDLSIGELLSVMSQNSLVIKILFVASLPDMGAAFLLNTLEMWRACRGMFAALGVYILICGTFLIINPI